MLRTQSLGADVEGHDGDALADVDVRPAADAVRIRRRQVSDITAMLDLAETADAAATAALPEPSVPDLDELGRALAGRHTTEPLGGREAGVA